MTELFDDATRTVSLDRQIEAAQREVRQRERVYPRRVAKGAMTKRQADLETEFMRQIVRSLQMKRITDAKLRIFEDLLQRAVVELGEEALQRETSGNGEDAQSLRDLVNEICEALQP